MHIHQVNTIHYTRQNHLKSNQVTCISTYLNPYSNTTLLSRHNITSMDKISSHYYQARPLLMTLTKFNCAITKQSPITLLNQVNLARNVTNFQLNITYH